MKFLKPVSRLLGALIIAIGIYFGATGQLWLGAGMVMTGAALIFSTIG